MLTQSGSLTRQARFRQALAALNLDAAVISDARDIYYLTGVMMPDRFPAGPALLYLAREGGAWLFAQPGEGTQNPNIPGVDECLTYQWDMGGTMHPDHTRRLNDLLVKRFAGAPSIKRLGYQSEALQRLCAETLAGALKPDAWTAIDDALADMQRRKDPDEIDLLRKCAQINIAAYTAVRAMIAPGVNELDVLATARRAASRAAGERVYHDGDFCSGESGGLARDRAIQAGELFIVDAQTCYRGYWSDHSRAYSVDHTPTPVQRSLHEHIAGIQREVGSWLKPGVTGMEIWQRMDKRIREYPALAEAGLGHHAGHGIGLRPHEAPDLNRTRGGVLEPGAVISVEPGGYLPEARAGVRLENSYLITETGSENISDFPLDL